MSEAAAINAARDAVSRLLTALGIAKVVCVDDVYARQWTEDDLVVAQGTLSEDDLRTIFKRPEDVFPEDREVRRQSFREAWAAVDPAQQQEVGNQILRTAAAKTPDEPNDLIASSALADIIGEGRLETVRPSNWPATKDAIKAKVPAERTLLLFDQDLSGDGGSATGGVALATDALSDEGMGDRVMCGLLTHTVSIETQHEEWVRLAQPPLDQDRFFVVAKGWLSRDPLGFARMLKLVALGPECRAMKRRTKELLDEATAEAQTEIDKIHIDDFDSMVFRASKQEGLWEPDMLFRLFGIYHRSAVRQRAYTDDELKGLATRLRSVSDIPTHSATSVPAVTWKVQRKEMYEAGEYINALHLPIEVGDIFAKTDGTAEKFFIVVGQPCDLMVRSDGKRSPDSSDIVLAEIFTTETPKEYTVQLPHFSASDQTRKFYVRLRPTHSVNPCVVDLCVFNTTGESKINTEAACPENVLPAWRPKFDHLKRFAESVLKRYEGFGENKVKDKQLLGFLRAEAPKQFPVFTSNTGLFKATLSLTPGARGLSFNCKRVMRLQRAHALAVALEYMQCMIRPAFERDLGN